MTLDEILALPTLDEQFKAMQAALKNTDDKVWQSIVEDPRYGDWLRKNRQEILRRNI